MQCIVVILWPCMRDFLSHFLQTKKGHLKLSKNIDLQFAIKFLQAIDDCNANVKMVGMHFYDSSGWRIFLNDTSS